MEIKGMLIIGEDVCYQDDKIVVTKNEEVKGFFIHYLKPKTHKFVLYSEVILLNSYLKEGDVK